MKVNTDEWKVIKRNGELVDFNAKSIENAIQNAAKDLEVEMVDIDLIMEQIFQEIEENLSEGAIGVEDIQDIVVNTLIDFNYHDVVRHFIEYRFEHKRIREFIEAKEAFIEKYKNASNTADATIDDNSNVGARNIAVVNNEIHKPDNIQVSRGLVMRKLRETRPDFDYKQYIRDLQHHRVYKHDESSFCGPQPPYCASISMYPFLNNGLKEIGGLSAAPKNIDSFCGIYINLIFAISSQFAGAIATSEFLLYFDYFARQEWGDNYYLNPGKVTRISVKHKKTIQEQIHQYFQQVIYSINQPTAARGMQSAFVNFSYFDKPFFEGMFGNFVFPDGTKPQWESLCWLQKEFMKWFNAERLKRVLTFPVESFALVYKDGKFLDQDSADFVAEEYARGHSFFTYISDSVDSLSSCCFEGDVRMMYSKDGDNHFEKCEPIKDAYEKNIGKVIKVLGYNPYTLKREWVRGKFIKTTSSELYKIVLKDRSCDWTYMTVTADHIFPILRNGKTIDIEARYLTKTDKMLADRAQWNLSEDDYSEISYVDIQSIERIDDKIDVYCVELEDKESPYFVLSNGIITHNCRLKNKVQTKEFNFTNGNMGVETGSKSVITLNLNRIIQDYFKSELCTREDAISMWKENRNDPDEKSKGSVAKGFAKYLTEILERVYIYHEAYNDILWDEYESGLLPTYNAGFIDLNKQYLTIGINGLNEAAEFLGLECSDNPEYEYFCQLIFSTIKEQNLKHKTKKLNFNTECVPAESLAIKNYNWDKADGYWVPEDRNLYASYIYKPSDPKRDIFEKIRMHGSRFIGDYLDGGSAAHLNLDAHLSKEQYMHILKYAAEEGCQYLTFNIPMSECRKCGHIVNAPIHECPMCGSDHITRYTRIIGYLTAVPNWSKGRQIEEKTRIYESVK